MTVEVRPAFLPPHECERMAASTNDPYFVFGGNGCVTGR
jgi:hypothetical protein